MLSDIFHVMKVVPVLFIYIYFFSYVYLLGVTQIKIFFLPFVYNLDY